jgi:lysophospholipase L1-like esterase
VKRWLCFFVYLYFLSAHVVSAHAQVPGFLEDVTGDELVTFVAIGDSLTYGVGDGTQPGEFIEEAPRTDGSQGYVPEVAALTGVTVINEGVPGEVFTRSGVGRVPSIVQSTGADIVAIFEGSNDAIFRTAAGTYERNLQKALNVIRALGRKALIFTLPEPCCDHDGLQQFVSSYSDQVLKLAELNEVRVADVRGVWRSTCPDPENCPLYNLPEGLHPNDRGYTAIAQTVAASLFGLNILDELQQADIANVLGISPDSLVVTPAILANTSDETN